jgi:hypothetical protein
MWCSPGNYRLRLLLDLAIAPLSVLLIVILRLQLGLFAIPAYFSVIFAWTTIRGKYAEFKHLREAHSFGARPIPQVVGKWPGNLDVLLRMIVAFKTSYISDVYLQLFEQYQSTTLNVRILWRDNVRFSRLESLHFFVRLGRV